MLVTQLGHSSRVREIAWSSDDKYIASCFWDGEIHVWDAVTGETLVTYREHASDGIYSIMATWSPDGSRIASSGFGEMTHVWDATTGATLMTCQEHPSTVDAAAWSPDSKRIASIGDKTVLISHVVTGEMLGTY